MSFKSAFLNRQISDGPDGYIFVAYSHQQLVSLMSFIRKKIEKYLL